MVFEHWTQIRSTAWRPSYQERSAKCSVWRKVSEAQVLTHVDKLGTIAFMIDFETVSR
jgi:hypothetical protein